MRLPSLRLLSLLILIVAVLPVTSLTQAQKAAQTEAPVFKTTSRLVVLDVVVTDKNGKPVSGLSRDDFNVFEDRELQRITQFEATTEHVANAISNTPVPFTIFVLDELNTTFEEGLFSRRSLAKYLRTQPEHLASPTMIIAVTNTDFRMLHDYTQDRQDLLKVIQARQPDYPWKLMRGFEKDRLARSLVALQQLAAANAGRSGRKNVVWIGRGFPSITFNGDMVDDDRITILDAVNRTTARLLESRITVYAIDPTMNTSASSSAFYEIDEGDIGTTNTPPDPWGADVSFGNFGPATGGRAFRSRNDIDGEIGESIADGATYYTLAYVPTNRSDDVKYRTIRIKMRQPGLTARTRNGYYGVEVKPTEKMIGLDMSQAAENPFAYTGIAVKAIASVNKNNPTSANCMVHVDAHGLTWTDLNNGNLRTEVEIAVAALRADGKLLAYDVKKFGSTNTPEYRKDLFQMPTRFPISTSLPKDTRRLRFVVRDAATGRIGTFDLERSQIN